MNGKEIKMIVYLVEIRREECDEHYITASYERAQKELREAESNPDIEVIVTPYKVADME